ncbi:phosphatidic acid phosphatase [Spirochaetia bacterium]|nr:phosphatidic acid phosphatase [Spirochaetia bacterium]
MSIAVPLQTAPLKAFFENPIFLSSVSSWFFAQLLKAAIALLGRRKRTPREIMETLAWRTGGMPSSHAALVSAMAASVGFREGPGSTLFAIAFFVALIVMRDAMGVRRASGLQGRVINYLGRTLAERLGVDYHPLKEVLGHTPLEVVMGALLGIFIASAYAWL